MVSLAQPCDRLGAVQGDAVLLQHRQVAGREDDLRAPVGQLVERGCLLRDDRRVLEDYVGDLRAHAEAVRTGRSRREERPHVLVVCLIRAVAPPEPELVHELDRRH
jgi:hypothetical protein